MSCSCFHNSCSERKKINAKEAGMAHFKTRCAPRPRFLKWLVRSRKLTISVMAWFCFICRFYATKMRYVNWRSPPVWPDLAKFCHFIKILKVLGQFLIFYLTFAKILNLLWHMFNYIWQFWSLQMAKNWQISLAIWSHWSPLSLKMFRLKRREFVNKPS